MLNEISSLVGTFMAERPEWSKLLTSSFCSKSGFDEGAEGLTANTPRALPTAFMRVFGRAQRERCRSLRVR